MPVPQLIRNTDYTIVGIYHDEDPAAYPVFVSLEKCRELRGNDLLNGYVWIENADTFTKDVTTFYPWYGDIINIEMN